MRILPVTTDMKPGNRPENDTLISCYVCPARATFSTAVATAWTFDADGVPFRAFYCPAHRPKEGKNRVNFKVTPTDRKLLVALAVRYCSRFHEADLQEVEMDYTACHVNGCPLDLTAWFAADDFNFLHDACGIRDHLDRNTGRLTNHFHPRFALEQ